MATVYKYVDPSAAGTGSGDDYTNAYTTLNGINAYAKNLVTADENLEVHVRSLSGTADSTLFSAAMGWVTDSTHKVEIICDQNHGGAWNTSVYRLDVAGTIGAFYAPNTVGATQVSFWTIRGLQIRYNGTNSTPTAVKLLASGSAKEVIFDKCIILSGDEVDTASGRCVAVANFYTEGSLKFINCIIGNGPRYAIDTAATGTMGPASCLLYNCTVVNSGKAFNASSGDMLVKNTIFTGMTDPTEISAFAAGSINNATDLSTELTGQTGARVGQLFTFFRSAQTTEISNDYHLVAGTDTGAVGYGSDLSADANYPFSTDMEGRVRTGSAWDIGASQAVITSLPAVGQTFIKGYPANEEGVQSGHITNAGKLSFIGKEVGTVIIRIATETPVVGKLSLKGLPAGTFVGAWTTPLVGQFLFKGYSAGGAPESITISPPMGLVTLKGHECIGDETKTKFVDRGVLTLKGGLAVDYQVRAYTTPTVGKWWFRGGIAIGAVAPRVSEPIAGVFNLKGGTHEANQATATKVLVAGQFNYLGTLPEGNAPAVNAPTVAGKLLFRGHVAMGINGEITKALPAQWVYKGYEVQAIKARWTIVPPCGKYTFMGMAHDLQSKARKTAIYSKLTFKGHEVASNGGLWSDIIPDDVVEWTDIPIEG
jgi:hypothetical protein